MSCSIYYFSGTGNSLAVAKDLAAELGDTVIYPIAKIMDQVKDNDRKFSPTGERVVIITPVYIGGLPNIVSDFASRLKFDESRKVYAIATHGGAAGRTLVQLDNILKKNGSGLSGGFLMEMPGNDILLYSAYPKDKQESYFRVAKLKVKEVAGKIKEGLSLPVEESLFPFNRLLSGPIYNIAISKFKDNDKQFYADEKCDGCGMCANICPVKNIKMEDKRPIWQHNCENCMACINWCPLEAIQHGKKTIKRVRYTHPQVKPEELMIK